jgi:hypothetical protein
MYTDDITGFVIRKPWDYKWDFAYRNTCPVLVGRRGEKDTLDGFPGLKPRAT